MKKIVENPITTEEKRMIGKRSRAAGKRFELKVRHEMEARDLIVCKWSNTVDFEKNKIVPSKAKFNFFTKVSTQGSGFPDYIVYLKKEDRHMFSHCVVGVESKMSKYLDQKEKDMCDWLIANKIFDKIFIAYNGELSSGKKGIVYLDYVSRCEYDEILEGMER